MKNNTKNKNENEKEKNKKGEETKNKPAKKKTENTKNYNNTKKAEKIEKTVKTEKAEKVIKKMNNNSKESLFKKIEEIDEKKKTIIAFAGGLLLGLLILFIVYPDRIAKLKDGTEPIVNFDGEVITADDLYSTMKDSFSISLLIDKIDRTILEKKYEDTDEMKKEVEETAEYWLNLYKQNGYDEETFLSNNNFKDKNAFLDYLSLDNRRQKYYKSYLEKKISEDDIKNYYETSVYGDTDTKHILVEVKDDGLSDDDAKKLAEEIISKLNSGTSWDDVITEYKDKITDEELGYQAYNASLDEAYLKEMLSLENNTYSQKPVKSSYGYHIVYRIDQKEKPALEDVRDSIISDLSKKLENEDSNLYYKALIEMRKEANIEFSDSVMKKKYNEYCDKYK